MKVLVTGANGYLGQGVVKELLDKGHEVVAVDMVTQNIDDRAEKKAVNLFEIEDPYKFFGQPDVLLHMAWRDGFVHYSEAHFNDLPNHIGFIKKFAELKLKSNLLIGSINRKGKTWIPRGQDTIQVGDTVIIVTTQKGLGDILDILRK